MPMLLLTDIREAPDWIPPEFVTLGLALNEPQYHCFVQSVKTRWIGKTVLDVFAGEYSCRERKYYEEAIARNRLRCYRQTKECPPAKRARVIMKPLDCRTHLLEGNENIEHECFMCEAVVPLVYSPAVVRSFDSYVAVNKPPGFPVYPQGPFESNTLLRSAAVSPQAAPFSRLDRLTSGLLLIANSRSDCSKLTLSVRKGHKFYLAKWTRKWEDILESFGVAEEGLNVEGTSLRKHATKKGIYFNEDIIVVSAPMVIDQHEPGTALKSVVDQVRGKPSLSVFVKVPQHSDVVLAVPVTGRTHQLRVHSAYIGAAVDADPLYWAASGGNKQYVFAVQWAKHKTQSFMERLDLRGDAVHILHTGDAWEYPFSTKSEGVVDVEKVWILNPQSPQENADFAFSDSSKEKIVSLHPCPMPFRIALQSFAVWSADGGLVALDGEFPRLCGIAAEPMDAEALRKRCLSMVDFLHHVPQLCASDP